MAAGMCGNNMFSFDSRTEGKREAEASRAIAGPEDGALSNRGLFSDLKT